MQTIVILGPAPYWSRSSWDLESNLTVFPTQKVTNATELSWVTANASLRIECLQLKIKIILISHKIRTEQLNRAGAAVWLTRLHKSLLQSSASSSALSIQLRSASGHGSSASRPSDSELYSRSLDHSHCTASLTHLLINSEISSVYFQTTVDLFTSPLRNKSKLFHTKIKNRPQPTLGSSACAICNYAITLDLTSSADYGHVRTNTRHRDPV